jgi:hypothetical protein
MGRAVRASEQMDTTSLAPSSLGGPGDYRREVQACGRRRSRPRGDGPTPGYANGFHDVAAVPGTTWAWAVGHFHSNALLADQTLTEFWDGTRWRQVPSPSLGQDTHDNDYLLGVTAI